MTKYAKKLFKNTGMILYKRFYERFYDELNMLDSFAYVKNSKEVKKTIAHNLACTVVWILEGK